MLDTIYFVHTTYFLLTLVQWLLLAIIGVRIYVDNFSREIYPGSMSETGGYEVASYTGYMIAYGVYLPVASVIVFVILNSAGMI